MKNSFDVPNGSVGKRFVAELAMVRALLLSP